MEMTQTEQSIEGALEEAREQATAPLLKQLLEQGNALAEHEAVIARLHEESASRQLNLGRANDTGDTARQELVEAQVEINRLRTALAGAQEGRLLMEVEQDAQARGESCGLCQAQGRSPAHGKRDCRESAVEWDHRCGSSYLRRSHPLEFHYGSWSF